jgi:ribokinase
VGDDVFGEMIKENLRLQGVNTDFIYSAPAISTGIIVTMVNSKGENSSCISEGANRSLGVDEVACVAAEQLIGAADVCLIQGDLPENAVVTAIRMAQLHGTKVVLEMGMTLEESGVVDNLTWPMECYSVNVLIPNFLNFGRGADFGAGVVHKLKLIGSELVGKGIECVVIKMGGRGSLVVDRQGSRRVKGFELELVDRSGCDDAFAGALGASACVGDDSDRAVKFACAAYALARSRFGSQDALPSKEDIIELLQSRPD